nr:MAG TPA: hypothetical protein [Caudoviricetes sp.]
MRTPGTSGKIMVSKQNIDKYPGPTYCQAGSLRDNRRGNSFRLKGRLLFLRFFVCFVSSS